MLKQATLFIIILFNSVVWVYSQQNSLNYQPNLFTGTSGHGHTYPGAAVPFGMIQLSPDTDDTGWDWCSGYHYSDSTIMGFSHTHLSGTGISDLADVLLMPFIGQVQLLAGNKDGNNQGYRSRFSHSEEYAEPGYYKVNLQKNNILAELTASEFSGHHRYTFPKSDSAGVFIDLLHGLDRHRTWLTERVLDSELHILDSVTIEGYRFSSGWSNIQKVFFRIQFSKPFKKYGIAIHDVYRDHSRLGKGRNVKGVVYFETREKELIEIEVTLSPDKLTKKLKTKPKNFDAVRKEASQKWNRQLSLIRVEAPSEIKSTFETALYRTSLAPNVLRKPPGNSINPHFDTEYSTLSQWDVYRAAFALNTIIRPHIVEGVIGTMMRAYDKNHYLPVWKLWEDEVNCMIGSPSVPILSEALIKGFVKDKRPLALEAIRKSLSIDNPVAPWSQFERYSYIPNDAGELFTVSKTLEMSYSHGCAALLLKKFYPQDKLLYEHHLLRSKYYKNVFDEKTGFFRGRNSQNAFTEPFDPKNTDEKDFVEATPWQYLFHVQHDIENMITLFGGKEKFTNKLDSLFSTSMGSIDNHILDITGLIGQYAHGNEPAHHVAYLYNYAGQYWKTQSLIHEICTKMYSAKPDGLCGNEDCGQMSAWFIFSALGFYPVHPSSATYSIGKPMVQSAVIQLPQEKVFKIVTKNFHPDYRFVKSVRINGKKLTTPLIAHSDFMKGGILEFELSDKEVKDCYKL